MTLHIKVFSLLITLALAQSFAKVKLLHGAPIFRNSHEICYSVCEVRNLRKIATVCCYRLVKYWCLDVPEMDTDLLQNFIEHNEVDNKISLRIF